MAAAPLSVPHESEKRYRIQNKSSTDETLDISNSQQLNEVQYQLGSLKGIIRREKKEQQAQKYWQFINLIIIGIYIAFLSIVLIIVNDIDTKITLLELPLWSLVWGGLGSLSAILFRFFTIKNRVKFSDEFKWLIARPIIGILMSSIAYLVTVSGLILLTPDTTPEDINENSMRVTSIVCFLAGFSDKVYLGIIDLLITRLNLREEPVNPEIRKAEKPIEKK